MNEQSTLLLYITIIVITSILGSCTQNRFMTIGVDLKVFKKIPFIFSFFISWFFFAFAGMSNDYLEYQHIFNVSQFNNFRKLWIEPGFALLNAIIKIFVSDPKVAIVFIKTIILILVYKVVYDYRHKVPVGMAILAYMCMAYLDAFCMIRIHLAAAVVLFAVDLYDNFDKKIISVLLILLAMSIHYSTFIFLFAVVSFLIYIKRNRVSVLFYLTFLVIIFVSRFIAVPIINYLTSNVPILMKYGAKYTSITKSGSGIVQYLLHIPFLYIFYALWNHINDRKRSDNRMLLIGLIMAPFSLFFGTMGYTFEVIGRSFVFFLYIWMFVLPRYYAIQREEHKKDWLLVGSLICVLLFFRLFIYLQSGSLESSGIMNYYFMWQ